MQLPVHATDEVVLLTLCGVMNLATAARVFKHRTIHGLAPAWVWLSLLACISWTWYGVLQENMLQVITSVITATCFAIVLVAAHHVGVLRVATSTLGIALLAGIIVGLGVSASTHGLGIAGLTLTLVNRIPQAIEAYRSPGGRAVSTLGTSADAVQSLLWTLTGVLRADLWLTLASAYCLAASVWVLLRAQAQRLRGAGHVPVPLMEPRVAT
jgi:uncharacterized protein with PQ loop repeat